VRDGAGVGFPGHLRITVGSRHHNDQLVAAWDHALTQEFR
jgi:histidinol-phosphate/aromatic aminotransferase/cobyric acid decarboxylase-like protein